MILSQAIFKFQHLKIDRAHGLAPHKPILLLSLIQAIDDNLITENRIYITPELVSLFKTTWSQLVTTPHECKFALPFYHLTSDGFWILKPKTGYEKILDLKYSMRTFNQLNTAVEYAEFSNNLFDILKSDVNRTLLKKTLLESYFPLSKNKFLNSGNTYLGSLELNIVNEAPEDYIEEIKGLRATLTTDRYEEEIFIRGGAFKREIPRIYNNTCCISELKINAILNISMIDACHIVPFSESYNDTVSNGIALCPNLHRAFDRGLLSIDQEFKVIISNCFSENETNYSIRKFEGKRIILPTVKKHFPDLDNLIWHNIHILKNR